MEKTEKKPIDIKTAATNTLVLLMRSLPHNQTKVYMELVLNNSNCLLYVPYTGRQLGDPENVRDHYQKLVNLAEL